MTYDPMSSPQTDDGYGAEVDFFGGLSLQLGRLTDHLQAAEARRHRMIEARKRLVPMHFDPIGSAVASAGGVVLINLASDGLPSAGRIWEVKRWIVGSNGVTPAAGQAWLCATGQQGGPINSAASIPLGDVCDASPTGAGLPYGNQFGARQVMVNSNEQLIVVIIGATPNATYLAAASVDDFDIRAELAGVTVGI